jgi:multidrug efflux system membrane fusion protein
MGGRGNAVAVVRATLGTLDEDLSALGTVTPLSTVTVHARVDGPLEQVLFQEGQLVRQGQPLVLIDSKPFEVQLQSARGQLAKDEAQQRSAQVDLDRYKTLLAQESVSKQVYDAQQALVKQYAGAVAVDQAAVDSAQLQLGYTRVLAPISGRVGLRQVDVGNMVHAADANGLVLITQVDPISVVFSLPQSQLPRVLAAMRQGRPLTVEAWDREEGRRLATGTLTAVDNQIDPTTGTVKLRAQFANPGGLLFPNQFVNVKLRVASWTDAVLLPSAVVQSGAPGLYVYVVQDDNKVSLRPVTLGASNGERVVITRGVKVGERVVSDGTDRLRDGATVTVIDRASAPAAPPAASAAASGAHRRHPAASEAP